MKQPYDPDVMRDRITRKLKLDPTTGCLEYQGSKYPGGHGQAYLCVVDGKHLTTRAHRAVWELERGPIPDGVCVLHRCDNPCCCNVDHLFLGTLRDNSRDMIAKGRGNNQKKTHCPNGHEYTEENTYRYQEKNGRNNRYCRICHKQHSLNHSRKRRAR